MIHVHMQEAVLEWRLARRPPLGAWRVEAVRRDGSEDLQAATQPHPRYWHMRPV